ncbi:hypothetical protein NCAS_0D01940 [Naumovozyma castellii]|uniref:SUN domain-containing protein n=1 Tax=Naumovozyma castellii TaxID=27288 RepID=G0VDY5_NAUCA|nr:hypothetical protein NCAS_0D01940 [Naumovozyma castellii CBS 4309]CCC69775.1 hypothetical protein NCAS_0D01940 [Naumovozyma castellii CBS 4309]
MNSDFSTDNEKSLRDVYKDLLMKKLDTSVYDEESSALSSPSSASDSDEGFETDDNGTYSTSDLDYESYDDTPINTNSFEIEKVYMPFKQLTTKQWLICAVIFFVTIALMSRNSNGATTATSVDDPIYHSLAILQKQLNHLHVEVEQQGNKRKTESDKRIRLLILQLEKNIRRLIPTNHKKMKTEIENLDSKVQELSRFVSTNAQVKMKDDESHYLMPPGSIPVVVGNDTESISSLLIRPSSYSSITEFLHLLKRYLNVQMSTMEEQRKTQVIKFIREVMERQYQYFNRDQFDNVLTDVLNQTNSKFDTKFELDLVQLYKDAKQSHLQMEDPDVSMRTKINHLVESQLNHLQGSHANFATRSQGTRLLTELTSDTYMNGNNINPAHLLWDSELPLYWMCYDTSKKYRCTWSIMFQEPLYLSNLYYYHGRFPRNLHMMNSAPKQISVYVKLANDAHVRTFVELARTNGGETTHILHQRDTSYVKIAQFTYNIHNRQLRQQIPLPRWFIAQKKMVQSLLFQVDTNQGNRKYTSLGQFTVNGLKQEDLRLLDSNHLAADL